MKAPKTEELERICAYCEYATVIAESDACVCKKRGVVRARGHCFRFRPDLLKVQPILPRLPDEPDDSSGKLAIDL